MYEGGWGLDFIYLVYDDIKSMREYEMNYFIKKTWSEHNVSVC